MNFEFSYIYLIDFVFKILTLKKAIINHEEKILDAEEIDEYPIIQEIIAIKEPFDKLWEMVFKLFESHEKWTNGPILELNAEEIEQEVLS